MSNRFVGFIKEHPYKSAALIALIVVAWIYLRRGSSASDGSVSSGMYQDQQAGEVAAATQYNIAQLQSNAAIRNSDNAAGVAEHQFDVQAIIAGLQSQDTLAGISATRDIQLNSDTLAAQTTQAVSTLQALVANNQTSAGIATAKINADAYISIANAPYAEKSHEADLNYAYLMATVPTSAQITALQNSVANTNAVVTDLSTSFDNYTGQANTALGEIAQNLSANYGGVKVVLPYGANTYGAYDTTDSKSYKVTTAQTALKK